MTISVKQVARRALPGALLVGGLAPRTPSRWRLGCVAALAALWTRAYVKYRASGRAQTRREWELLRTASWEAYTRHYNERVPTIEEEFDIWGKYHQHRHEMRYDLVAAAVREHLPSGGAVLDIGCGSALVADRITDVPAFYVGVDFGGHHIAYARKKLQAAGGRLASAVARCDGESLPFPAASFDVVVLSEVIEHLLRPERAVWEISRVLRPGGVLVMTTNNASEVPLESPLRNPLSWVEKAVGADHPRVISLRPWIWPERVDPALLPSDAPPVYLPHTHHIQAETRCLFAGAGLETFRWSTFEFPPPQSATAAFLDRRGKGGRRAADVIEFFAQHTPVVRRLGCHLFMLARKVNAPVSTLPTPGIWPGPFSDGADAVSALAAPEGDELRPPPSGRSAGVAASTSDD